MRAPVVAPLPAELLALDVVHGGDQERAGLVEQPVRLRLTRAERRRRVEAIEHAVAVEEEQPVLGSAPRREEEQLQLIGRQHPVPVQVERDLPVALGQMPRQLEQPLRAHAERPSPRQNSNLALFVGVRENGPSRRFARPDALLRERGDAAGSAAHNAVETAARTDPAAFPCSVEQQLGEQANGVLALVAAQRHQLWRTKLKLGSPTQSSRGQRRSRSHYQRGPITAANRTPSIEECRKCGFNRTPSLKQCAFERPFLTVASYGLRRFHLYREATLVARSLQHLASNRRSDGRGRGRLANPR